MYISYVYNKHSVSVFCILPDMGQGEIERLMGQVHALLKERMAKEGLPTFVTTSYGIVYREPGDMRRISDVAVEADQKMYECKEASRRNGER